MRCDCSIADSCVTPAPDAITSHADRRGYRRVFPLDASHDPPPPPAPATARRAVARPAGAERRACRREGYTIPLCPVGRELANGTVRACRRSVVGGVDGYRSYVRRPVVSTLFRRVPSAYPGYTHRRAPVETALPPAAPRRAYPVPRGAGGSSFTSTLAARHPPPASSPVVEPRRAFKRKPGRPHPDPRRTTDPGPTEAPCPRPGPRAPTRMKVVEDGRTMS